MPKRGVKQRQQKLAELLRRFRLDANLRQIDVARRLGQPQSYVSKYESAERGLTLLDLREICRALGIPLVELVRRFEEENR